MTGTPLYGADIESSVDLVGGSNGGSYVPYKLVGGGKKKRKKSKKSKRRRTSKRTKHCKCKVCLCKPCNCKPKSRRRKTLKYLRASLKSRKKTRN